LPSIFPGSWINGDFYIWIGHRDDHRAWDQLSRAREVFDKRATRVAPAERDRALEELLIAEGSDWFWWYGDDHSSDHDADFDDLFRRHLRNAYAALGEPIPEELFATNITTGAGPDRLQPSGILTVTLDGKDTSFLEWVGAAAPPLARPGGAMHEVAASPLIADIRIGTSASGLCVRLGGARLPALLKAGDASLALVVADTAVRVLSIERAWFRADSIVEIEIPFDRIGTAAGSDLQFGIQVRDRLDSIIESVPRGRHWSITVPTAQLAKLDWQA
jgi:hypothetical protein